MTTLFDGTVLPSFMKVLEGAGPTGTDLSLNDYRIHVGRVVAIHGPNQSTNNNRKFFEYDVEVDVGGGVKKIYPRCVMSDPFGGFADYVQWTPRLSHGTDETGSKVDYGSRVFVLCINGHASRGIIIGGAKHHALPKESQDEGHHFVAVFNGVRMKINSLGELELLRNGPTFSDGTLTEEDQEDEAYIKLNDLGDIELTVGKEVDATVYLDSENQRVLIEAQDEVIVNAGGNTKIESAGLLVGDATDATMLAETFRQQQQILHNTIIPLLIQLASLLATAGGATAAAGASLGVAGGLHVIPIAGPMVGAPAVVAAGTALATAGSSIAAAAPLVSQIMAAIQAFEALSEAYLSKKNRND
jgi:hypothetical protein